MLYKQVLHNSDQKKTINFQELLSRNGFNDFSRKDSYKKIVPGVAKKSTATFDDRAENPAVSNGPKLGRGQTFKYQSKQDISTDQKPVKEGTMEAWALENELNFLYCEEARWKINKDTDLRKVLKKSMTKMLEGQPE